MSFRNLCRDCFRHCLLREVAVTLFACNIALGAVGDLDPSFGTGGVVVAPVVASAYAVALQADGKIVAAGIAARDFHLTRYKPDGTLDTSFGLNGYVTTDFGDGGLDSARVVVVQPDGKLVAAGIARGGPGGSDFGLARYNADGSLDTSFGVGGKVVTDLNGYYESAMALVLQPDGKLVALGGPGGFLLARYNSDGTLDSSFGAGGRANVSGGLGMGLALQPDGRIVAAGQGSTGNFVLVRLNVNGALDATFGTGGTVSTDFGGTEGAFAVVVQPDGKIVAGGGADVLAYSSGLTSDFLLARYNSDGSLDNSFGTGGRVTTDFNFFSIDRVYTLAVQADGRILAGGSAANSRGSQLGGFALARYNGNGTLDGSFGSFGKVKTNVSASGILGITLQPDGKVVAVGGADYPLCCFEFGPFVLARYLVVDSSCMVNTLGVGPQSSLTISARDTQSGGVVKTVMKPLVPDIFRDVREKVLALSPQGRRYIALYNSHTAEVVGLMVKDSTLRSALLRGLLLWQDDAAAIVSGSRTTLRTEQIRAMDDVVNRLAQIGSAGLRTAVDNERRNHPKGLSFTEGVLRNLGVK